LEINHDRFRKKIERKRHKRTEKPNSNELIENMINVKAPQILDCVMRYGRWEPARTDFSLSDAAIPLVLAVSGWLRDPGNRSNGEWVLMQVLHIRADASKRILDDLRANGYNGFPYTLNLPAAKVEGWNRIVDILLKMPLEIRVLIRSIAKEISIAYED
jgi:hypothetical protein